MPNPRLCRKQDHAQPGMAVLCPFDDMILGLFRSTRNAVIDRLYVAVVDASRQPALYLQLGIPDTFEGRFESLTLHVVLVLRRLRDGPAPGPDMAQHLVDTLFRHFDRTLREMGVGDTSVPKRMRQMAEAFLGRSAAYDEAIRAGGEALAGALQRNVYGGSRDGAPLARYMAACAHTLTLTPMKTLVDAAPRFADPAAFADPPTLSPEVAE